VFDTGNEPAIPDKYISVLFVDRAGGVIGTRSGVGRTENGHFTPFNKIADRARLRARHHEGGAGRLWVGTEAACFRSYGRDRATCSSATLKDLASDVAKHLGGTGPAAVDGHSTRASAKTTVPLGDNTRTPDGKAGVVDGNGNRSPRIAYRDHFMSWLPGHFSSVVRVLGASAWQFMDRQNGSGRVRWRDARFATLAASVCASDLHSLLEDDEGSLWIGSHGPGYCGCVMEIRIGRRPEV